MLDKQFHIIFSNAVSLPVDDRDAFLDYWMHRGVEIEQDDIPDDADPDLYLLDQLESIWDVAHLSVRDIRKRLGLSQMGFCDRYCIPRRTLQDWESETNRTPPYVILLLAENLGIFCAERLTSSRIRGILYMESGDTQSPRVRG